MIWANWHGARRTGDGNCGGLDWEQCNWNAESREAVEAGQGPPGRQHECHQHAGAGRSELAVTARAGLATLQG